MINNNNTFLIIDCIGVIGSREPKQPQFSSEPLECCTNKSTVKKIKTPKVLNKVICLGLKLITKKMPNINSKPIKNLLLKGTKTNGISTNRKIINSKNSIGNSLATAETINTKPIIILSAILILWGIKFILQK